MLPFRADEELSSTFSFSSSSATLRAGLATILAFETFVLTCACSPATDDTLRCGTGVVATAPFADEDRESDEMRPVGVGVPIKDGRDLSGGGPIAPSTEGRTFVLEEEADALVFTLTRALFPRAAILAETGCGVSEEFRSFLGGTTSVPESEMTEGGREPATGVGLNTDESRRCTVLEG